MPIRNKPGFIPKSARHQPDYYIELFQHICAVYTHPTTNATLYMEVDAERIWAYNNFMDAKGNLNIQYQSDCRYSIGHSYKTLREAIEKMDKILDNPTFGENFNHKPVHTVHHHRYANVNLQQPTPKFRRKGNGKRFRLTESHKAILKESGTREQNFPWLEEGANRGTFVLDETLPEARAINAWEALELLGERTFLSGLDRATDHWTCDRETPDGKHTVSFNMSIIHKS